MNSLHVMKNPAGTFSFVGTIPKKLATIVKADKSAVMGGRAFSHNGIAYMFKLPVFNTEQEAIKFAASKNATVVTR